MPPPDKIPRLRPCINRTIFIQNRDECIYDRLHFSRCHFASKVHLTRALSHHIFNVYIAPMILQIKFVKRIQYFQFNYSLVVTRFLSSFSRFSFSTNASNCFCNESRCRFVFVNFFLRSSFSWVSWKFLKLIEWNHQILDEILIN